MVSLKKTGFGGILFLAIGALQIFANDAEEMFEARVELLAVIKFTIQYGVQCETVTIYGLVINNKGGVVVLPGSIPAWIPKDRIQDVCIFQLDEKQEDFKGEYIGEDLRTNWHYFKVDRAHWAKFSCITKWEKGSPKVADRVWGVGILHLADYFYKPVYMSTHVGSIEYVPYGLVVCDGQVGAVSGPVFSEKGKFMRWSTSGISDVYKLQMNGEDFDVALQRAQRTNSFLKSKDFYKYVLKEPISQLQREWPWLGIVGIDFQAAKFLGLDNRTALLVGEVVEGSPAAEAGLQSGDIITAVNGNAFKKYASNSDVIYAFHLQLYKNLPGEELKFTVIRGDERKEILVILGKLPKRSNEAPREYYPRSGFSIREFVYEDAIQNQYFKMDYNGAIVQYVQPSGVAEAAELIPGDWIKGINGKTVTTYDDAKNAIDAAMSDKNCDAVVLLVMRDDETKLVRVNLK